MIGVATLIQALKGNRRKYMLRVAAKRSLLTALLTALIVFCSAMLTAIDRGKVSWLVLASACLMAIVAFCTKLLEQISHEP